MRDVKGRTQEGSGCRSILRFAGYISGEGSGSLIRFPFKEEGKKGGHPAEKQDRRLNRRLQNRGRKRAETLMVRFRCWGP